MNKVILMGRLTADPELRQTQGGVSSARFTIAVNRNYKNAKGEYEADFISCQAWRNTADFITKYFAKGQMIAVVGTLRTGSYTDRNHNDVTHYTTDVLVESVEFTGSKNNGAGGNTSSGAGQQNSYNNSGAGQNSYYNSGAGQAPMPNNDALSYGDLGDFEEILSDGDVPF